jgi:hypothetical protein
MIRPIAICVAVCQLALAAWNLRWGVWDGATIAGTLSSILPGLRSFRRLMFSIGLVAIWLGPALVLPEHLAWLPARLLCLAISVRVFVMTVDDRYKEASFKLAICSIVLCSGAVVIRSNPGKLFNHAYQIPVGYMLAALLLFWPFYLQLEMTLDWVVRKVEERRSG